MTTSFQTLPPLVSIGIGGNVLLNAIPELVANVYRQTYTNWEIFIWTSEVAAASALLVPQKPGDGPIKVASAVNPYQATIGQARGKYLVWLEPDVRWESNYLEVCLHLMEGHPEAALCSGGVQPDGEDTLSYGVFALETRSIQGSVLKRIEPFLTSIGISEFYGLVRLDMLRNLDWTVVHAAPEFLEPLVLLHLVLEGPFLKTLTVGSQLPVKAFPEGERYFTRLAKRLLETLLARYPDKSDALGIQAACIEAVAYRNLRWAKVILQENGIEIYDPPMMGFIIEKLIVPRDHIHGISYREHYASVNDLREHVELAIQERNAQKQSTENAPTAVVLHILNPFPARDGSNHRCSAMIRGLQAAGYQVKLFSSNLFHLSPWSFSALQLTEREMNIQIALYIGQTLDYYFLHRRQGQITPWQAHITPTLTDYYFKWVLGVSPDVVFASYAFWSKLAIQTRVKGITKIIDTIDLLSLNKKMAGAANQYLVESHPGGPPYSAALVEEDFLREDFYTSRHLAPDKEEFAVYDQFDLSIAINPHERDIIDRETQNTQVHYIPFHFKTRYAGNTYSAPPVFAIGPNQFNFQGYMYFVRKVLPIVRRERPDFMLHVIGDGCSQIKPAEGVELLGYVPDLPLQYKHSRFAICPLIGATGQQLKVMEAMAFGLPVVVLRNVAERCQVVHGQNGLVADTVEEFATYTLMLYNDPRLCQTLGENARARIGTDYSEEQITARLNQLYMEVSYKKNKLALPGSYLLISLQNYMVIKKLQTELYLAWNLPGLRAKYSRKRLIKKLKFYKNKFKFRKRLAYLRSVITGIKG